MSRGCHERAVSPGIDHHDLAAAAICSLFRFKRRGDGERSVSGGWVEKTILTGDGLDRRVYEAQGIRRKVSQLTTSNAAPFALAAMLVTGLAAAGGASVSRLPQPQLLNGSATSENDELQALKQRLVSAEATAEQAEAKLRALTVGPPLNSTPAMAASARVAAAQPDDRVLKLQAQNAVTVATLQSIKADRDQLRAQLDQVQKSAAQAQRDRAQLEQIVALERKKLGAKVAELRFRLVKSGRAASLPEEASVSPSTKGEGKTADFNIHTFLARLGVRSPAVGGPFVALRGNARAAKNIDPATLQFLRTLPLTAPLDHYRLESTFGARVDPINGREAFHAGLDMSGPYRTLVFNTAPGTVVYAGYANSYGKLVEIDHGHGIHTKYAHLNRITVNVGQHLKPHTRIGLLGSTGRSTGPHVHYEVTVNGTAEDPAKFLNAGRLLVSAR